MKVANEVTEQILVGPPDFGGGHGAEAFQKLTWLEELPAWCRGDFKAHRRLDFVEAYEEAVV